MIKSIVDKKRYFKRQGGMPKQGLDKVGEINNKLRTPLRLMEYIFLAYYHGNTKV